MNIKKPLQDYKGEIAQVFMMRIPVQKPSHWKAQGWASEEIALTDRSVTVRNKGSGWRRQAVTGKCMQ